MSAFTTLKNIIAELPITDILRERLAFALEQIRVLENENALLKAENAALMSEIIDLKSRLSVLQQKNNALHKDSNDGERCPFCRMNTAKLIRIEDDRDFGHYVKHGYYECKRCGQAFDQEMKP